MSAIHISLNSVDADSDKKQMDFQGLKIHPSFLCLRAKLPENLRLLLGWRRSIFWAGVRIVVSIPQEGWDSITANGHWNYVLPMIVRGRDREGKSGRDGARL
jgi:hypothetical protein